MRHITMRVMAKVRDPDELKTAIQARGLTYAGVARYAKLKSRQFIGELCGGHASNCSPDTAKLIAEVVGRPVDDLFVETVSPLSRRSVARRVAAERAHQAEKRESAA